MPGLTKPIRTHNRPVCGNIHKNVAYDFELSSKFASYLGSIVTSDKNAGHFSLENLENEKAITFDHWCQ